MSNSDNFYNDHKSVINIDYIFYGVVILLAAVIVGYFTLDTKLYLQHKQAEDLEVKLLQLGTGDRQAFNQRVFAYKHAIDDFADLVNNHHSTSALFAFLEANTIPQVWFSGFSLQEKSAEVVLAGEAKTLDDVGKQVKVFENSPTVVKEVSVVNSQVQDNGTVTFTMNMTLDPSVLSYANIFLESSQ